MEIAREKRTYLNLSRLARPRAPPAPPRAPPRERFTGASRAIPLTGAFFALVSFLGWFFHILPPRPMWACFLRCGDAIPLSWWYLRVHPLRLRGRPRPALAQQVAAMILRNLYCSPIGEQIFLVVPPCPSPQRPPAPARQDLSKPVKTCEHRPELVRGNAAGVCPNLPRPPVNLQRKTGLSQVASQAKPKRKCQMTSTRWEIFIFSPINSDDDTPGKSSVTNCTLSPNASGVHRVMSTMPRM